MLLFKQLISMQIDFKYYKLPATLLQCNFQQHDQKTTHENKTARTSRIPTALEVT